MEGPSLGGYNQSQKQHFCELCQQGGDGNRFKGHHINQRKCEGKGVKNYYSRLKNKRASNIF